MNKNGFKRITTWLIIVCMLFTVGLLRTVYAEESVTWVGDGSQENPYQVASAAHLDDVRNKINENYGRVYFIQTAEINLSAAGYDNWIPIGDDTNRFRGSYDGQGFIISGLSINSTLEYAGLFGCLGSGTITELKNIRLETVDIVSSYNDETHYVGGLVGYIYDGNVLNCSSKGNVRGGIRGQIGGLIGYIASGTVTNCSSSSIVSGDGTSSRGGSNVGGLIGLMGAYATVNNCISDSSVSVEKLGHVGGLLAQNSGIINNSKSSGNVSAGEWSTAGGFAAFASSNSKIYNCYSTASVSGNTTGGFVASGTGTFEILNCYFDRTKAGIDVSVGGTAKDTEYMKLKDTFAGWDFIGTWKLVDGTGYPTLRWEPWTADEEIAEAERLLTWDVIKGINISAYEVTEMLELTTTGERGTTISWSVIAGDSWINLSTGDITRPAYEEGDKQVTLSARISKTGGTALFKEFSFIIEANEQGWVGEGDGSQLTPYLVSNIDQLKDIPNRMGPGVYFRQTNDISLSEEENWTPIGNSDSPFKGYYNGSGYTISGLYINNGSLPYIGLFGYNEGNIENVILENMSVYGSYNNSQISTCIGALVGRNKGNVNNCSSVGGTVSGSNGLIGGLVGFNDSGTIRKSFNSSSVSSGANTTVGGITGTNAGSIQDCYNIGSISGSSGMTGGLVGYNATGASIGYSYNSGSVSGSGALVGFNYNFEFGLPHGVIHNSYFLETSGANNGLGSSKNTVQMKQMSTFSSWNFNDTWRIAEGYLHPVLRWQSQSINEDVALTASALNWDMIKGDNTAADNVTSNLVLPSTGSFGTSISWSVDIGGAWINADNGAITRPTLADGNKQVTLTATVRKTGGTDQSKQFILTVKKLQHTLTYTAGANGTIGGSASQIVNHGSSGSTVTAIPNSGYHFVCWSDGVTTSSRLDSIIEDDLSITAQFAQNTALTITAHAKSKTYGDSDPVLTYTITAGALATGDAITGTLQRESGNNAGTYNILQGSLNAGPKYDINFISTNLTINPKSLSVTAEAKSKIYGYADPGLTYQITSGSLVGSDTLSGQLTRAAGENVGIYEIQQGSLTAGSNYNLSFASASFTIDKRAITIKPHALSKIYGYADPGLTYQITSGSLVGGDALTGQLTRAAGENVGIYEIQQGSLTAGSNYIVTYVPEYLTINKRSLIVTAGDKSKVYDGEGYSGFTVAYEGFAEGENASVLSGMLAFSGAATTESAAGSYGIIPGGLSSDNYNIVFVNGTLEITQKGLIITAVDKSKTYDGGIYSDFTITYEGFAAGEGESDLSGILVFSGTAATAANVGTYIITPGGLTSGNYDIIFENGRLEITKRDLTVEADAVSKIYGDADSDLGYQITSGALAGSDTFSGVLSRMPGESVGAYQIQQNTFTAGENYNLTFVPASLTITQKTLTVAAVAESKFYDSSTAAVITGAELVGVVPGDTVVLENHEAGAFAQSDAGTGIVVTVSMSISGDDAENYILTQPSLSADINAKQLSIRANAASKTYGDSEPVLTYELVGELEEGDSFSGELIRTEGDNAGIYEILIGSLSAGPNYDISYEAADFTINKAVLTVTADNKSKIYGAEDPVLTYTVSGELFYDDTASVVSGVVLSTVTGTNTTVGKHAITAADGVADNYDIIHVDGVLTVNWPPSNDSPRESKAPAPTPTPLEESKENTSNAPTLNENTGVASMEIANDTLITALEKAAQGIDSKKVIEIAIPAVEGALAYEPILPASALTSSESGMELEIKTSIAVVTLPGNMLETEEQEAIQKVSLTIARGDVSSVQNEEVRNRIGDRPLIQLNLKVDGEKVAWRNESSPVTVSIPYTPTEEELLDTEYITIWYIDGEGNVMEVPSGRYNPVTGMVTFSTTHFSDYAVVYVKKTFEDIKDITWANKQIEVLASKGILRGTSESEYSPSESITRADYLYYLVRALGFDTRFDVNFDDIDKDAYYYKEIGIAKKLGITNGTGDNKFSPDATITRQDMFVLTERALRILGKPIKTGKLIDLIKFTDRSQIADYAKDSIAALTKEGLIEGDGNSLKPLSNTSRAEAAVFIYRLYNLK